jgi:hypothetical protein
MRFGNNNHHVASMAGKATLMISRIKKMTDMSAMGMSFLLFDIRDTGEDRKKLQEVFDRELYKNQ